MMFFLFFGFALIVGRRSTEAGEVRAAAVLCMLTFALIVGLSS